MKATKILMLLLLVFSIWNCTNDSEADLIETEEEQINDDSNNSGVTYESTVRAIIQNGCVGCHNSPPRNGAPFALVTYQQVSTRASSILSAMSRQNGSAGAMPPSGRLPQNSIDKIQEWIDNNLLEN
ncbi:MAG: putative membrane protein [Maribacter sp.]|jgi:uncharacterized membrane protein